MKHAIQALTVLACLSSALSGAEPAKSNDASSEQPLDPGAMPVNEWVKRPIGGWKGKTSWGRAIWFAWTAAPDRGVILLSPERKGTAEVRTFDVSSTSWKELAAAKIEKGYRDRKHNRTPVQEFLYGTQLCYDSDRNVLVGRTSTGLDGRGRTVEFDLQAKKYTTLELDPSPPIVTAASLCYDPVNKEVVLATGGFSPVGGTDGTWLYDGSKQQWRCLQTPAEVDAVRLPIEKAQERLTALRWLVWKNIEFRVTGREDRIEERASAKTLADEATALARTLKDLAATATKNAGSAKRAYHRENLAVGGKLLDKAGAELGAAAKAVPSASAEEFEAIYRGRVVPAAQAVEEAVDLLAVTPEPRMSSRLVYDPKTKQIICFGGDGQDRGWSDTWLYHCEGRWWERKHWRVDGMSGSSRAVAFDSRNGVMVRLQARTKHGHHIGWNVWIYDSEKAEWYDTSIQAPRGIAWLEYDPVSGCLVGLNSDMKNHAWLLKLDRKALDMKAARTGPRPGPPVPKGPYILRDAAHVADLVKWREEQSEWARSVPGNTWVSVPTRGTGRPNWGRTWSSIVYDPDRLQVYYKGGGHGSYHGAVTDHYDIPTGRWFRSDRRYHPPWPMGTYFAWGRSFGYAPWAVHTYKYGLFMNPLRKRMQRSIGQSGRMKGAPPGAVIEYDPDTGRWARDLQSLGAGAGGAFGGGVTVPGVPDAMLSINNFSRYGVKNGTATLITESGTKEFKGLGIIPRAYDDHNFCWFFDPKRNRAMYYGAGMKKGKGKPPALYALDLTAAGPKWQMLALQPGKEGNAGNGLPHYTREVVYVPRHDRFLMIEGLVGHGYKGPPIIWELNVEAGAWRKLNLGTADKMPYHGGTAIGLQYDPVTDLVFYMAASGKTPTMYAFRYIPEGGGE